jgi:hypothetical protein
MHDTKTFRPHFNNHYKHLLHYSTVQAEIVFIHCSKVNIMLRETIHHIPQVINSSTPLILIFTNTLPALLRIQYFNHQRRQPRILPNPTPGTTVILHAPSFHFLYRIQDLYMYADLDRLYFTYYTITASEHYHSTP